ncbi:Class II flagellar assembly regulator [Cohaesibacter sp. ES.047]|uniref:flagellar assembly protein FliX n=1 Tax=Cohaesibacter sp. ES.047 TaxID=1798205 RepID=UPI000BB85A1E|nr:flagellar assembly protein FliX [Cohaesibacter sp. ES.047]SNY94272.1 Class II flagellar assembly regulator [Cohaesibacter sp. ES.047]
MRILGGKATNQIGKTGAGNKARGSSGSFSVPEETGHTEQARQTVHSSAVHDVSSLMALQGVEDALHGKRRKAVRRGHKMLDLLEEIRAALLGGGLPMSVLRQLERLSDENELSGDDRIDELLIEISLRAQVEVAKFEQARAVAT